MSRELLLLRHGKSDWSTPYRDFQRPLKTRGTCEAQRIGVWLAQQGLQPDYVMTSPAKRARITAEKTLKAMGLGQSIQEIVNEPRIYEASLQELLAVLTECPKKARRVLLVGHNPGLERLLVYLSNETIPIPKNGKLLPTATLARLHLSKQWYRLEPGEAQLQSITRGADLPQDVS